MNSGVSDPGVSPPTAADVERAAHVIEGHAVRTPLLDAAALHRRAGRRILVKAEPLQRTGSFKFRGAFNRISAIPEADRPRGVVAFSSGNHAQGVAAAAGILGIPATIVMPDDAPTVKRRNTEALGARVRLYRRHGEDREAIAAAIVAETGATLVRPYDDPAVIAGQGTVGLEIAAQCTALGVVPDAVLVCCGGGGLTAGIVLAMAAAMPGVPVHTVEPAGFDDTARSIAAGQRLPNTAGPTTLCDGLMAPQPGRLTFPINMRGVTSGFAVDDEAIRAAMRAAFEDLRLVVEPSGAAALAAALDRATLPAAQTIVCVATGGNVDPALYREVLAAA